MRGLCPVSIFTDGFLYAYRFYGTIVTMAASELYLIRHGESQMNTNTHLIGGRSNETPLTKRGIRQTQLLGEYLLRNDILPMAVFASPAIRTVETARHTLAAMNINVQPVIADEIQEMDHKIPKNTQRKYPKDNPLTDVMRYQTHFWCAGAGLSATSCLFRLLVLAKASFLELYCATRTSDYARFTCCRRSKPNPSKAKENCLTHKG